MRARIFILHFFILSSLLSCSTVKDSRIEIIDEIFTSLHTEERFNGNILISEKGKVIYKKSFGYAHYENEVRLDQSSIFNIASVSKTFTAVSILMLEEKGMLGLGDKIENYFPNFPYKKITIKNLLTHSSGLQRIQSQPFRKEIEGKGYNNQQILDVFIKLKPDLYFKPGTNYKYSNTNYIFLALIVEQVSGLSFEDFLKTNFFEILKMNSTFLEKDNVPNEFEKHLVSYYRKPHWLSNGFQNTIGLEENIVELNTFKNNYGESDIHTTTGDLLKFHEALQNGKLISLISLEKMYKSYKPYNNEKYILSEKSNYPSQRGLSWNIAKDSLTGKVVYHAGGFRGGRSFFIRNLTNDQCIIILTNNTETDFYTFTSPMRIMNKIGYQLDKKKLARLFANEYMKNGIESAVEKYNQFKGDEDYIPIIDWDFEEIGQELIKKKDYKSAVSLYKLYTEKYNDEFAWTLLGDAYLMNGNKIEAKKSFERALHINANYNPALKQLMTISD
ncbi:serine hydrolase domain-containing protein [Flagellimonas eckloniae]|uniref:Beta-lactamase-related domain-containing protein n=1 Tax=Flagellimonas eckloniae TaxID=346185 RepID=A0A0Q1DKS8_9FLAO|nr:serine hydrolase domain-containing protein [Allomuricauda eckloniae]KQC29484.1 hypothetical protein AAY42_05930 [Allomuricauda eckloniae]